MPWCFCVEQDASSGNWGIKIGTPVQKLFGQASVERSLAMGISRVSLIKKNVVRLEGPPIVPVPGL